MKPRTRSKLISFISESVPEEVNSMKGRIRDTDNPGNWYKHETLENCKRCDTYNVRVSTSWRKKSDKGRRNYLVRRDNFHLSRVKAKCLNCGIEMEFKAPDRIIWNDKSLEFSFVRDGSINSIDGIGPKYAKRLKDAFVDSHEDLIAIDAAELASETGISENRISDWQKTAEEQTEEV